MLGDSRQDGEARPGRASTRNSLPVRAATRSPFGAVDTNVPARVDASRPKAGAAGHKRQRTVGPTVGGRAPSRGMRMVQAAAQAQPVRPGRAIDADQRTGTRPTAGAAGGQPTVTDFASLKRAFERRPEMFAELLQGDGHS